MGSHLGITFRRLWKAEVEVFEIVGSSPTDNRHMVMRCDKFTRLIGSLDEFSYGELFPRILYIDKMMGDVVQNFGFRLCGSDVEMSVHLLGVCVNDLISGRKHLLEKSSLSHSRGAEEKQQGTTPYRQRSTQSPPSEPSPVRWKPLYRCCSLFPDRHSRSARSPD